ncbi:MAG: porin family protein [Cytophagales bacterium]|nr:porin family protein [Cytophagales bacterium]
MAKVKTIIAALIFTSVAAHHNDIYAQKSLKIGLTVSNLTMGMGNVTSPFTSVPLPKYTYNSVSSVGFGVVIQHKTHKNLGIHIELNYHKTGLNISTTTMYDNKPLAYIRNIHNLSAPLLAHFELLNSRFKIILQEGVQVGFAFGSDEQYDTERRYNFSYFNYEPDTQYKQTNPLQFGILLGAGLGYSMPLATVQITYRFYNPFTNIIQPQGLSSVSYYTNTISAHIFINIYEKNKTILNETD